MTDITRKIPIVENTKNLVFFPANLDREIFLTAKFYQGWIFFLTQTEYRAEESLYLGLVSLCNND